MSISLTVIICHYEQHSELLRCVRSVLCQSNLPERIIIIDDGSRVKPKLGELSGELKTRIDICQLSSNSGGPARPRNTGIFLCETSHVAFLDADDQWLPRTIESMKKVWKEKPKAIAHGDMVCWTDCGKNAYFQGSAGKDKHDMKPRDITYKGLLESGNHLFLSTIGGPTQVFKENLFDENQQWEDYDLWLRLCRRGEVFKHTGEIHTLYQVNRGSRSGSRAARHAGCMGIMKGHLRYQPVWKWPMWYWKQRLL